MYYSLITLSQSHIFHLSSLDADPNLLELIVTQSPSHTLALVRVHAFELVFFSVRLLPCYQHLRYANILVPELELRTALMFYKSRAIVNLGISWFLLVLFMVLILRQNRVCGKQVTKHKCKSD